jgi:DNA-binding NtrC family response regulator
MSKIFIIEDDEDTSDILTLALGNKHNLLIINDTNSMMERISEFLPDFIIMDNFVGQKVAAEIIKEIRSQHFFSKIPVILFSAHPDIEKISKEIAANAYISKPFTLQDLNSCIDKVSAKLTGEKEVKA